MLRFLCFLLLFASRLAFAADICNLDSIYVENGFHYSLPRPILESYLSGKAFDHEEEYSPQELEELKKDIEKIYKEVMSVNSSKEKIAVITAGAPGAGKTTLMEHDLRAHENASYIDPDAVCLKKMKNTYLVDIEHDRSHKARRDAYNKWRPGSNAACHLILANLIMDGLHFYFGTTSTAPQTANFFNLLKNEGYSIRLLHVTAPDDVRVNSVLKRDEVFIQTTEEDVREKGKLLPQRISDTYLRYADTIEFYWRGGVEESAMLAAVWSKENETCTLKIVDPTAYENIKKHHNDLVEKLGKPELRWELTVENK